MVRSVIRRLGLTVLSLMVLLGSMISFPTVTVYAAIEGDFEYGPAFAEGVKITAYHGATGGHVDIPNQLGGLTVTEIGYEAFMEKGLTSVTIPNSVTYIHERAFYSNQLTSITLPTNISTVGIEAFKNNQLTSLTIPSSINIIAQAAFEGNKLTSLNLPAKNFNISIQAFRYNELTSLIIPEGMTYVGVEVFQGNKLTSLSLPNSLTHLARDSFKDNELTTLTIPASVTQINQSAFEGNNISSLTILSNELVIKESAFRNNKLSELTIPEGVLSIGTDAFQYNELTSLSLPSSLTTIGNGVFKNNKLSELTIPEGVLSIGADAFQYNNLTSLSLPSSLTTIGDGAFKDNELSELTIPEGVLSIGAEAFLNNDLTSLSLPSSLTTIGNVAFQNNELTELTLPNSVTTIGAGAFEANKLSSINFPTNLHTIEDGVFKNNLLTSLVIPNYVTSIKNEAFASNRLESLILPDNGLTIGMHAFNDNLLVSLTIPNSIYVINVGAFRYNKLTSVTLSESITSLSAEVFEYNELTSLQIPESVSTIQANAFKNNKLTSLILPEDLVFIGEGAFEGNEISSLIFLNSDVFLANNAFRDNQLTSLTIPEGMERIRENVFQGNKLTSLTLPDSLTRIDSFTFSYNELQYLTIPKNMISVYPFAFSYNPSLSDVLILSPTVELREEHIFYNSSPDLRLHGYAGSTTETYAATIGATFQPINAELEDIQLNIAGFTFDPVVRNFNVMTNAASVIVTPIARSPFSIVTVNDEPVIYGESASAIPLVTGANSITIDVEAADGNSSEQYKIVLNVNQTAPTLDLSATPTTPTNGNVTINIEAVDAGSGIVALKWATGNENVAFFATGGQNVVDDKFEVSANGTYTVYARDGAGNEVVKTITVSNIASDAPVISLTATPTTPTNGNVTIEIEMDGASSGLASFKWAVGNQDEAFFATGGQNVVDDKFEVTANGTYTVYARDNAGNEVVETINVGNIDKTAPTLDLTPSTVALTFGNVTVAIKAEDADSGIAQLKWSTGNRDASFFAEGGQVVVDDKFMAFTNGIYTVYARDAAGNEVVRTINISNIDKIAPTLALTATPTAPTNGNVTVVVEAEDAVSGIAELKWASGNQNQAFFETGGQNVVDDQFVVSGNGIYTAYARDVMGNGVVRTINVTNIDKTAPTLALTATPTAPTNGNVTIEVEADGTGSAIASVKWTVGDENDAFFATGGQNVVDAAIEATANGIYTVYARDAAGNEAVRTITISNIDRLVPTIALTASSTAPTSGNVTVEVEADGTGSGIASVKWATGNQNAAFFATGGTNVVDAAIEATANGIYTVYARDAAGNDAVSTITISNIDRLVPTIALTASSTAPTSGNVTIEVEADGTGSGIASVKWATGNQNEAYFATGGQNVVDDAFEIATNGVYTVYARDIAGNEAVRTITIGNIDRDNPTLELTASPTAPTSGKVTVEVEADGTGSAITSVKWAAGNQNAAFFATGGQNIADGAFEATANGEYTVYARDAAGNETVRMITIGNIDHEAPTLELTASPTAPTSGNVTVSVEVEDMGSGFGELKWAAGNQNAAFFATGGTNVADAAFEATTNGIYTVYARDVVGNEAVRTISISNIDRLAPTIALTASSTAPTSGNVTIEVETDGTGSAIASVKWATGNQDEAYFTSGGTNVADAAFEATANGIYTIYARDAAGNEAVAAITLSNIDRAVPTLDLTASTVAPTSGNVMVEVEANGTGSAIASVKWATGNQNAAFFTTDGQNVADAAFEATANGIYTVYARDAAGNEAVSTITVSNIDRAAPTLDLTASPTSPTNGNVTVSVEVEDTGSGIGELKWAAGNQNAAFFTTGGTNITDDAFEATANGIYTVYARDAAGNEAVRTITVSNIDQAAPTLELTASPTEPTTANVTVTVEADGTGSTIDIVRWAAGEQEAAFFAEDGEDLVDDEFTVTTNGTYTVYARDYAGNEAVEVITISNIVRSSPTEPSSDEDNRPVSNLIKNSGIIIIEVAPRDIKKVSNDNGEVKEVVILPNDVWNEIPKLLNEVERPIIRIVIDNKHSDVEVQLPAKRLAELRNINSNVEFQVQMNKSSFQLLVNILDLEQLSKQLGIPVNDLNVIIKITELTGETKQQFILAAEEQGLRLLSEVIQFQLLVSGGDKLVEITDFGGTYLTKSILLESQLTTRNYLVVLYDPDRQTFAYVPAVLEGRSDDQQNAVIQMPHNSIYAIVDAERVQFADMKGHWARSVVEQLGTKRIVKGITSSDFGPNRNITRAEFASLLVRALGIKTNRNASGTVFEDVASTSWYSAEVEAAFKAGLIKGVSTTHFAPDQPITREQIALMLINAWRLVNDEAQAIEQNARALDTYTDASEVSSWAREAIAEALALQLMQGISASRLAPTELATRAQAAVMLHRFMVKIKFLD